MISETQYNFESYFVDDGNTVIHVDCNKIDDESWYSVLIDATEDPDLLYFAGEHPKYEDDFRLILFDFLKKKYPKHFY